MFLTPSQRIKILKQISERLSVEEWSVIDLTLNQFGVSTQDSWSSDKVSYVLAMAKHADDETLNGLADHFELSGVQSSAPKVLHPSFWKEGMVKVFISHLATQRKFAGELQESLAKHGFSAFVAHNDIKPTSEWQIEIEKGLTTCDVLVALLHADFHLSNWTDQEIGFAMGRGVPVFAVRLGQDPYGFIGRFQAFNGHGKPASVLAAELFEACRDNKQVSGLMQSALVGLLEKSPSFDAARVRTGYLERFDSWEPEFTARVRSAIENNSQVSGSWGVPARIEALIEKWDPGAKKSSPSIAGDDDLPF